MSVLWVALLNKGRTIATQWLERLLKTKKKGKHVTETVDETLDRRGGKYGGYRAQGSFADSLKMLMRNQPQWEYLEPYQRDALEMIAVKVSRILHGPDVRYVDHWLDIEGYAKLVRDILEDETADKKWILEDETAAKKWKCLNCKESFPKASVVDGCPTCGFRSIA